MVEKITIVFDVGIDGCREVVWIYTITVRIIVLPVSCVVDQEGI
jgi:hypothetical protein